MRGCYVRPPWRRPGDTSTAARSTRSRTTRRWRCSSRSTADGGQPILQTSVWGRTHLNVGWFDDVDSTLDLAACERLGIQVIRRPFAGGGTAFYDAGCAVMFGLMLPKPADPATTISTR